MGAGARGPCPGEAGRPALPEQARADRREAARLRQEERALAEERRLERKEAERRAVAEKRASEGAGARGPCPGEAGRPALPEQARADRQEAGRLREEERASMGAGARGPCPGEAAGGRPAADREALEEKEALRQGPPFLGEAAADEEEALKMYRRWLRSWARFGLSRACQQCGTLTPGKHYGASKTTGQLACRNCREKKTKYLLPALPPVPPELAALNALERRLLAMAKVNQHLIDKLPAGGTPGQWGRMYVTPLGEPALCNLMDGAELGEDGRVYIDGAQGMVASTARVGRLRAALLVLKEQHASYKRSPAVDELLSKMEGALAARAEDGGAEEEAELEVTYMMPRDPAAPKADQEDLRRLRTKPSAANFRWSWRKLARFTSLKRPPSTAAPTPAWTSRLSKKARPTSP